MDYLKKGEYWNIYKQSVFIFLKNIDNHIRPVECSVKMTKITVLSFKYIDNKNDLELKSSKILNIIEILENRLKIETFLVLRQNYCTVKQGSIITLKIEL